MKPPSLSTLRAGLAPTVKQEKNKSKVSPAALRAAYKIIRRSTLSQAHNAEEFAAIIDDEFTFPNEEEIKLAAETIYRVANFAPEDRDRPLIARFDQVPLEETIKVIKDLFDKAQK